MIQGRARRLTHLLGVLLAELVLILAFLPPTAALAQVPNGVYEGSHSGGGTIKITLAGDGATLVKAEIFNVPGDICTWSTFTLVPTGNPPRVINGELVGTADGGDHLRARFVSSTRAEGTFKVSGQTPAGRLCSSPTYSFTATAGGGGAPAPQPQPTPQPPRPGTPPSPQQPPASSGNSCRPGESPKFQFGLLALKGQLGDVMGDPIDCEHPNSANGDTLQRTSRGLAYYRKATNTPTFTNGDEHWALRPEGLLYWTGPAVDPP